MARPKRTQLLKQLKPRAIIYTRVSSREQQEEGYSLDAQMGLLRGYCLAKGFEVVGEIVEAETAKASGRPKFNQMCLSIAKGEADIIVVEKTDRLHRNLEDKVMTQKVGCAVHFVKEGVILSPESKSSDKLMANIKTVLAVHQIDQSGEEASKGMAEKASQGLYPSCAPLGYRNTIKAGRRVIEPDPDLAPKLRLLFSLYATGDHSVRDMADHAAKLGATSARGKKLSSSTIHRMLINSVYVGPFKWNGVLCQGTHEPLIEWDIWDRVQAIIAGRGSQSQPVSKYYIYRGLVRCGICGCLMSPYTAKGKYTYYSCSGFKGCSKKVISEDAITNAVASHFEGLAIKEEYLMPLRERVMAHFQKSDAEHDQTVAFFDARRLQLEKRLKNLYLDSVAGKMSEEIYDSLRLDLEKDLAEVKAEIARTDVEKLKSWTEITEFIKLLSNLAFSFKNADSVNKRIMFNSALSNCSVLDGKVSFGLRPGFKAVWEANVSTCENRDVSQLAGQIERLTNSLLTFEGLPDGLLAI